jgi:hypothetical protein
MHEAPPVVCIPGVPAGALEKAGASNGPRSVYSVRVSKPTGKSPSLKAPETAVLSRVERREFIKTSSLLAGALTFGVPTLLRGQNLNSKLNIACGNRWEGFEATLMPAPASERRWP